MQFDQFKKSLSLEQPPDGISNLLEALWYAGKDKWEMAHDIADGIPSDNGSWVHAYLHRWEGDEWNANYWYRRAGRKMPQSSLEEEWEHLVHTFL